MLQAINRYEPLVAHVTESANIHPEQFFGLCVSAAGELATFTTTSKRPPKIPPYRHDRLRECFEPVMIALRESLSKVLVQNAVPIPIQPGRFGISVAVVNDRSLFDDAVFILAARADLPSDELRRRFPAQLKIGPSERIGDLVRCNCRAFRSAPYLSRRGRSRTTPDLRISSSISLTVSGNR